MDIDPEETPFTSADVEKLFEELDRDRSGRINYRELLEELKKKERGGLGSPETIKIAKKLLKRQSECIVVLGAPTKVKKALMSRLAYIFGGTWLSIRTLADREIVCPGSKIAGEIKRKQEKLDNRQDYSYLNYLNF